MQSAFALAALAPLVAAYCQQYSDVSVDVTLIDRPIDLIEEGFDAAIVVAGTLRSVDVITRQVTGSRFVACCTQSYLKVIAPETYAELFDHRVLCLKSQAKKLTADGCKTPHVSNNTAMLRLLAKQGAGIAILPAYIVAEDLADGSLVQVLSKERLEHFTIQVAYPSRRYVPSKVVRFVEMSLEYLTAINLKQSESAPTERN
jgi:DNA-binding transcriptional LysR family regulator